MSAYTSALSFNASMHQLPSQEYSDALGVRAGGGGRDTNRKYCKREEYKKPKECKKYNNKSVTIINTLKKEYEILKYIESNII
jgi:hypothetical protein